MDKIVASPVCRTNYVRAAPDASPESLSSGETINAFPSE